MSVTDSLYIAGSIIPGIVTGVASAGHYTYAAAFNGMHVIDSSDPGCPIPLAHLPDECREVIVDGHLVYLGGRRTFTVVDVSNPSAPVVIGRLGWGADPQEMVISGEHVFVADLRYGLRIVSVANPRAPRQVGRLQDPLRAAGVAVLGDIAFVTYYNMQFRAVDISNRSTPVAIAKAIHAGSGKGMALDGNYAYVASDAGGPQVIDFSSIKSLDPQVFPVGPASEIESRGHLAFLAGGPLRMIDLSEEEPRLLSSLDISTMSMAVSEERLIVGARIGPEYGPADYYLASVDVLGERMAIRDTVRVPVAPYHMAISGDHVFTVSRHNPDVLMALQVVSVSNEDSLRLEAVFPDVCGNDIESIHPYLYLTDCIYSDTGANEVRVIDVTDPIAPVTIGYFPVGVRAWGLARSGSMLGVAGYFGVDVLDISHPEHPRSLGLAPAIRPVERAIISGGRVYAGGSTLRHVNDITNPAVPDYVVVLEGGGHVSDMVLGNGRILGATNNGLETYPLECDDTPPELLACITSLEGKADGRTVRLAWQVEWGSFKNFVIERAPGEDPPREDYVVLNEDHPVPGTNREFVDSTAQWSQVYSYKVIGHSPLLTKATEAMTVATTGEPPAPPAMLIIGDPNPNPMSTSCDLMLDLPESQDVDLRIYSAAGHLVWKQSKACPAGASHVTWNGIDLRGRTVPAGRYFALIQVSSTTHLRRLTVVR
jgi:hypothetical protein